MACQCMKTKFPGQVCITHLVSCKTVMQFNDPNLVSPFLGSEPCLFKCYIRGSLTHAEAHKFHCASAFKSHRFVGAQYGGDNFDGLVFQFVGVNEVLGCDNTTRSCTYFRDWGCLKSR